MGPLKKYILSTNPFGIAVCLFQNGICCAFSHRPGLQRRVACCVESFSFINGRKGSPALCGCWAGVCWPHGSPRRAFSPTALCFTHLIPELAAALLPLHTSSVQRGITDPSSGLCVCSDGARCTLWAALLGAVRTGLMPCLVSVPACFLQNGRCWRG